MRFFWVDGRLGWPLVIWIVFGTTSVLVLDYVWRTVIISADTLIIYAAVVDASLAIMLAALLRFGQGRLSKCLTAKLR